MEKIVIVVFALACAGVRSQWTCSSSADCSSVSGSVCVGGECSCPPGQQVVQRGSACVDISPYMESPCVEDHQCKRLFTGFECRGGGNQSRACFCQDGYHFFLGRCWRSLDFGESCTHSEECFGVFKDPFALSCQGTCQCSEGYYLRQRGECRRFSSAAGGGCVVDSDCQFEGGACDQQTFTCVVGPTKSNVIDFETDSIDKMADSSNKMADNSNKMAAQRVPCNITEPCASPFQCSSFGVCICPPGYYESEDGSMCYAALGSPSTPQQCVGLLAVVNGGVCSCPTNFYYDENMKDCIRVTRRLQESCVNDDNCRTFGAAAHCGPPAEPWGLRACQCDPDLSVWDERRQLCRYFAGVGEACEVDSDCLAGTLEIRCEEDLQGTRRCSCPPHLLEIDGLCLTTGLDLGAPCQHPLECAADNSVCLSVCSCADGYRPLNGTCAPVIGGSCELDSDCLVEDTECLASPGGGRRCSCRPGTVEVGDSCLPEAPGYGQPCTVSAQCLPALGEGGQCLSGVCVCAAHAHYRDGACWPVTHLFQRCGSSSQCYLEDSSDRVVCRNSLCQCDFRYPYSRQDNTCLSSSASPSGLSLLVTTLLAAAYITLR